MKRTLPGLFAMLVVLTSCASGAGSSPPGSSGDGGIAHPTGDDSVLTVAFSGGMVPVDMQVLSLPTFVLLGDGRVIIQGAQDMMFPGPALPALLERTLTEAGIQDVLEGVEGTNLFTEDRELRAAQNMVADASDTVFHFVAAGRDVTVTAYALGTISGPDIGDVPGLTAADIAADRVLNQLASSLSTIDTSVPAEAWEAEGWQPYQPTAFRLYVRDASGEPVDGEIQPEVRAWPTDDDPATIGMPFDGLTPGARCFAVEGEAAATWLVELANANQLTQWTTDGTDRYAVQARPLLPYEAVTCP
jgi:hypothetical protein